MKYKLNHQGSCRLWLVMLLSPGIVLLGKADPISIIPDLAAWADVQQQSAVCSLITRVTLTSL